MDILSLVTTTIAIVASLGAGGFYLRYVATKANMDGLKETVTILQGQNTVLDDELRRKNTLLTQAQSENKLLREIASQTPEVVKLTQSVSRLTAETAKQHKEVTSTLSELIEYLTRRKTKPRGKKS